MSLHELRIKRNLTQKELAERSGINYRSLQDYEQGHKQLSSSSGSTLLRLSTALGCTIEDLLLNDFEGATLSSSNQVDVNVIQRQHFHSEEYNVSGRWVCVEDSVAILFYYKGKSYYIPFDAVFTPKMLPCLIEAAILQMESVIDELIARENGFENW